MMKTENGTKFPQNSPTTVFHVKVEKVQYFPYIYGPSARSGENLVV